MLKSLPLERLYRDSRCGALMLPWTAELCLDPRPALGEPGGVEFDQQRARLGGGGARDGGVAHAVHPRSGGIGVTLGEFSHRAQHTGGARRGAPNCGERVSFWQPAHPGFSKGNIRSGHAEELREERFPFPPIAP